MSPRSVAGAAGRHPKKAEAVVEDGTAESADI
jgi:hypothetical protein